MQASITIAGIEVGLSTTAGSLETVVADRYAAYLGAPVAQVCSLRLEPIVDVALGEARICTTVERETASRFRVTDPEFHGLLDLGGPGALRTACDLGAVDRALRTLFALLVPHHDAVMLNAGGIMDGNTAQVFLGPSGGRAAAAASNGGRRPVFAGDYVLVRRLGPGAWLASSTPFGSVFAGASSLREAMLTQLWAVLPVTVAARRITSESAEARTITEAIVVPTADAVGHGIARALAVEILDTVPCSDAPLGLVSDALAEVAAPTVLAPSARTRSMFHHHPDEVTSTWQ